MEKIPLQILQSSFTLLIIKRKDERNCPINSRRNSRLRCNFI